MVARLAATLAPSSGEGAEIMKCGKAERVSPDHPKRLPVLAPTSAHARTGLVRRRGEPRTVRLRVIPRGGLRRPGSLATWPFACLPAGTSVVTGGMHVGV